MGKNASENNDSNDGNNHTVMLKVTKNNLNAFAILM